MSRRLRRCIPTVSKCLKPNVVNSKSAMQKKYGYDQIQRNYLHAYMQVRGECIPITVTSKEGPPSPYFVKTANGKKYHRNSTYTKGSSASTQLHSRDSGYKYFRRPSTSGTNTITITLAPIIFSTVILFT